MTDQIEKLMKALDCTEEEAKDIIEQDYKIDHGERVYFDLSKEQEKEAKKFGNVPRAKKVPTVYKFEKKKAKPDPTKEGLIQFLAEKLAEFEEICNIDVTNPTKQIDFSMGEDNFYISLRRKRAKKSAEGR